MEKSRSQLIEEILGYKYQEFRTKLTFTDVRRDLLQEQHRRTRYNDYMFVTRKTVLGRWHQIKKEMFSATGIEEYIKKMSYKGLLMISKNII